MRKSALVVGILLSVSLVSCDFILKDRKSNETQDKSIVTDGGKTVVGEEDGFGCAYTAGYRYSYLSEDCIRVFEVGFRLNPIDDDANAGSDLENDLENNEVSCFVLFAKDGKEAEIFLPQKEKSIVLTSDRTKTIYLNEGWSLNVENGMVLKYKDQIKFTAAKTIDLQLIHSDQVIEGVEEGDLF
ncbi:hypothetical protein [Myroides sp. DF42-4-2]|uniref:hypothetical protein n=1 Tax=unclassified Myroides TaxID=2642485 RepID=UPI0025784807|nr:hypothetical protein [Myroides sp. DF42-4-2]MDM1406994.1 hypothetical protein [Myroides sp. DF42-4-2]